MIERIKLEIDPHKSSLSKICNLELKVNELVDAFNAGTPESLPFFNDIQIGYLKTAVRTMQTHAFDNNLLSHREADAITFLKKLIKDNERSE